MIQDRSLLPFRAQDLSREDFSRLAPVGRIDDSDRRAAFFGLGAVHELLLRKNDGVLEKGVDGLAHSFHHVLFFLHHNGLRHFLGVARDAADEALQFGI